MIVLAFVIFMLAALTIAAYLEERYGWGLPDDGDDFDARWDRSWSDR